MRFNPAQEAELEKHWVWMNTCPRAKCEDLARRFELRDHLEGLRSADVDLVHGVRQDSVRKHEITRWINNRRRAGADGVPRAAKQKTPAQLAVLEASFNDEVYPNHLEVMRIISLTELSKTQIASWFETRRKHRMQDGGVCWTRTAEGWTGVPPPPEVARAWKEWKEKSEEIKAAFVEAKRTGLGDMSREQCRRVGWRRPFSFLPNPEGGRSSQ